MYLSFILGHLKAKATASIIKTTLQIICIWLCGVGQLMETKGVGGCWGGHVTTVCI